ncbi:isochorismate synthase [Pseudooceanicola aestuarii]|uniref:isochorismate synthase n=1 Tax=Pseudooceanicola aestuarii TaxID=2697319 RepID=UPI0013D095D3|nr:isochorismate synthase [Pseudooceanicola aestuarii]
MTVTEQQRRLIAAAAAAGQGFALWRAGGASAFTAIATTGAARVRPVFGGAGPGFAICPFVTEDGAQAQVIPADLLADAGGTVFADGQGGTRDAPVTPEQTRLVDAMAALREGAPVRIAATRPAPRATAQADYEALVARAVAHIQGGACEKIVLSRAETRDLPADHDLIAMVETAARAHPRAFVALVFTPQAGCWLIATPEILVQQTDDQVVSMALAGTQWPQEGTALADVTWPEKIVVEQGLVSDYVRDAFAAAGIAGVAETPPRSVEAGHLVHLRSDFTAPLAGNDATALNDLLRRLHPTSAVCGMPKAPAMDFLRFEEGYDRGAYTGYLGPVDVAGETALYVNLRSALVGGNQIHLHVGGGIVAASDPAVEWQETVEKTRTIAVVL